MANQVMAGIKETAQWIYGDVRPWSEVFDLSAFSSPSSFDEADTRVAQNAVRFRSNYAIVITIILALTLITRPFAVLYFLAVATAWCFRYYDREQPLVTVALLFALIAALRFHGLTLGIMPLFQHALHRGTHDLVAAE